MNNVNEKKYTGDGSNEQRILIKKNRVETGSERSYQASLQRHHAIRVLEVFGTTPGRSSEATT